MASSAFPSAMPAGGSGDPSNILNSQLASALSTLGDAQFYEDSISPSTIRTSLEQADPSNANSTPTLLRGMKWLLAYMSKGRDVSDFYPSVVKLVGAQSLEVRKMVYMYLVQYADHDASTRELSLLSINSFQRGLVDAEQFIRGLALRVLSSIRITDILQIQILGVQKCSKDHSPYVRKCAANALAKLNPRCDESQREMLLEIIQSLLDEEAATMVLTSAVIAFCELCPERLEMLHGSYRKLCHLLTDMDEWGQIVVIDTLARYCRKFFQQPRGTGSAEYIDAERRIRRTVSGIAQQQEMMMDRNRSNNTNNVGEALDTLFKNGKSDNNNNDGSLRKEKGGGGGGGAAPKKIKRRVVRKAFYSDEEDESSEEEVYEHSSTLAGAMRQRDIMGLGIVGGVGVSVSSGGSAILPTATAALAETGDDEDGELDDDHRLLLRSSLSLLKSRHSGVVLSVCSLHYYCGVASIKIRSALGKALVRIHRDRREIQYVVLSSIRTLVMECPSAFIPYLDEFFVKAFDPSFSRIIKLEILTQLALEPASIEAVLKEMRTYIRHDDKRFACASLQSVGRIVENAQIIYERIGKKDGNPEEARSQANLVALNCLYGLVSLTESSQNNEVVGEAVIVMQRILLHLMSSGDEDRSRDPNHVQNMALRRIVLLLFRSLNSLQENDEHSDDDAVDKEKEWLKSRTIVLTQAASASALWITGEALSQNSNSFFRSSKTATKKMRYEFLRLLARSFPDMEPCLKVQSVHFASKMFLMIHSSSSSKNNDDGEKEATLCEHILSMGRMDANQDVRDRSRHDSSLLHVCIGLKNDVENLATLPTTNNDNNKQLTVLHAKNILLRQKPPSSSLPLVEETKKSSSSLSSSTAKNNNSNNNGEGPFRFGTLSSLVSHRARKSYMPLPPWANKNSPSSLRDPPAKQPKLEEQSKRGAANDDNDDGWKVGKKKQATSFYDSEEESSSADEEGSTEEESTEEESSEDDDDSSEDESSEDESSESSEEDASEDASDDENDSSSESVAMAKEPSPPAIAANLLFGSTTETSLIDKPAGQEVHGRSSTDEDDHDSSEEDDDESESSEGDSSDSDDEIEVHAPSTNSNSITSAGQDANLLSFGTASRSRKAPPVERQTSSSSSLVNNDLEGLVMGPVVVTNDEPAKADVERDSSVWTQLVRHELGGGLSVKARYLRGPTKEREAGLIGLDPKAPTTVCLQVKLENRRSDAGTLRRVRMVQRSSSASGGAIAPSRMLFPPEIAALKKGQMTMVTVGLSFPSISDREGCFLAKIEIKSDRASNPVEIRPPLGELLIPWGDAAASSGGKKKLPSKADFDAGVEQLHGIHQRVVSKMGGVLKEKGADVPSAILKHVNMTPLEKERTWKNNELHLIGRLPASKDPIYVLVSRTDGEVTVCCDSAIAGNSIMDCLKKAASFLSDKK